MAPLTGLQERPKFHFHSHFNHLLCVDKLLSNSKLACEASLLKLEVETNSLNWTRLNTKNYTSVKQLIILFMKCSLFQDNCMWSSVKAILIALMSGGPKHLMTLGTAGRSSQNFFFFLIYEELIFSAAALLLLKYNNTSLGKCESPAIKYS